MNYTYIINRTIFDRPVLTILEVNGIKSQASMGVRYEDKKLTDDELYVWAWELVMNWWELPSDVTLKDIYIRIVRDAKR